MNAAETPGDDTPPAVADRIGGASESPGDASPVIDIRDSQGVVVGDRAQVTNVFRGAGRVAGSAYLEQVRDIAPGELLDRETKLRQRVSNTGRAG